MGPTTLPAPRLPHSFTSLYRLFLRASSAAVLHHRAATRYIRPLWKPTFREAAVVVRRLQNPTLGSSEKAPLERWLCLWELSSECQISVSSQSLNLVLSGQNTLDTFYISPVSRPCTQTDAKPLLSKFWLPEVPGKHTLWSHPVLGPTPTRIQTSREKTSLSDRRRKFRRPKLGRIGGDCKNGGRKRQAYAWQNGVSSATSLGRLCDLCLPLIAVNHTPYEYKISLR
jgi:hypothetical protein